MKNNPKANWRMFKTGFWLMVGSVLFAIAETGYFGWNRFPVTRAELTCDIIAGAICATGAAIFFYSIYRQNRYYKNQNKNLL